MIEILLFRLFSGFKNASYYGRSQGYQISFGTISLVGLILSILYAVIKAPNIITLLCLTAVVIVLLLEHRAFRKGIATQIHLLELLFTSLFSLALLLSCQNIWTILVASWVGNSLFNMPINFVSSGKVIEKIDFTDDPTGKTFGLHIGKWKIGVPRISNGYVSLGVSIALTIIWALTVKYLPYTLCDIPFINAYLKY